jgi:hypothetical protein
MWGSILGEVLIKSAKQLNFAEYFWGLKNSVGQYLVPSAVPATPVRPSNDRGLLPILSPT